MLPPAVLILAVFLAPAIAWAGGWYLGRASTRQDTRMHEPSSMPESHRRQPDVPEVTAVDLEVYKMLCDRVEHEVQELFSINKMFLVMAGAILAGTVTQFGKWPFHLVGGLCGIAIAGWWSVSVRSQITWKRWWIAETARQEARFYSVKSWQRAAGVIRDEYSPDTNISSATEPLNSPWVIFLVLSGMSLLYGAVLVFCLVFGNDRMCICQWAKSAAIAFQDQF